MRGRWIVAVYWVDHPLLIHTRLWGTVQAERGDLIVILEPELTAEQRKVVDPRTIQDIRSIDVLEGPFPEPKIVADKINQGRELSSRSSILSDHVNRCEYHNSDDNSHD